MHTAVLAQSEHSSTEATGRGGVASTFVNDYQAIGINPANLGRSSHTLSFTFLEGGLGVSSRAFTPDIIRDFRSSSATEGELGIAKRRNYAKAFASDDVLHVGADLSTFAIAVNLPKLGGFAISNRQRMLGHAGFNKNFSELLFLGQDAPIVKEAGNELVYVSDVFEGTKLKVSWLQEWNIAFGRQLINLPGVSISGGVGYRYVRGLALGEFQVQNGQVKAHGSVTPTLARGNESYIENPLSALTEAGKALTPVGQGHGFDFGLSAVIAKDVKVAVSVTDMGSVRWTENLFVGEDRGFALSDIKSSDSYTFDHVIDMAEQVVNTAMEFTPQDELTTKLPTRLRLGAGMKVASNVELGVDYVHALNDAAGNLTQDFVGLGVDVMPTRFLRLSSGVSTGAGEKVNLPIGVTFVTPVYEFGLSTRDITAPLSNENPGASLAFAFLRFKVGPL
ncbi:DUF5723 family protein [Pontibacter kalidii]|uniref:DUF5723 family protein n=1 Tax=Pontibacter kalidii TaxID=2592049 RepID=UPI00224E2E9E|nr:DUF5723 family protein [Pontibacter kalidii]